MTVPGGLRARKVQRRMPSRRREVGQGMKRSAFLAAVRAAFLVSPLLVVWTSTAVAHEVWNWPAPDMTGSISALSTTTTDTKDDLSDKSVLPPIVMPLEWSGGPIEAKVLLIGNHLNYDSRYSYAIVDLFEGVMKIYPKGHHHITDEGEGLLSWASFTPHGDVLIYYRYSQHVVYFVPDGDFSLEPTIIRPRRIGARRLGDRSERIKALGDKSRSMVWVSQTSVIQPRYSKDGSRIETTWIDLMKVDNSEIVMTVRLEGEYRIAGLLDDGLLVAGIKDEIIISPDGSIRRFAACSNYHRDSLSYAFIAAVHDQYYACTMYGRLFIMDINTGRLHTLTAPDQGTWYVSSLHNISSLHNGNFFPVSRWTPLGSWDTPEGPLDSAYIVSLSEQTFRRVYTRGDNRLRLPLKSIDSGYIITTGKAEEEDQLFIWLFDYESGHWSKLTVALDDYYYIYDIW